MNDNKVKKYPLRHLSIRVPWHDRGWDGTVCKSPEKNSACLKLTRISKNKDEEAEVKIAGKSIKELDQNLWPCCIPERSAFMSSFYFIRDVEHPYHKSSPTTHGHIQRTPVRHPAYSAATVPFRWMFKESFKEFSLEYGLNLDTAREPDLKFKTPWVQDHQNQRELLNCFFNHIKPESSLCFFYAKQVPFVEDSRRVLIGVGRVLHIGDISEYSYSKESEFRSVIWERMIQHSIRPEFNDGFLLPYHKAIKHAQDNPDFDPSIIAAFAPQDHWLEFSYAAEHVSHDGAISSLLSCAASLNNAKKYLPGQWDKCLRWINDRLGEIWKMRGPCPGLGSALCAFGIEQGTFIAREIEAKLEENVDPWPVIDQILTETTDILSMETSKTIGTTIRKTWAKLPQERKSLLKLISRFELSPAQARLLYVQEEREKAQIQHTDSQILENPYLIYELTRLTTDPISIWTVDRGVFPEKIVREKHPLPSPSELDTGLDVRRVRALVVDVLERSADNGNTLLSRKDIILIIRNLELQPSCDVTGDIMEVAEEIFPGVVERILFNDGNPAYQLLRLAQVGDVIRNAVLKRKDGKRHIVNENWEQFLNSKLDPTEPGDMKQEKRARIEKAAALKELSESRISVLIGPAGTGKTTLLSILCSQKDIAEGEVLLLAPTGKARVRMQEETNRRGLDIKGLTIAQFLGKSNRYDYKTGIYRLSDIKA
ncbi:MAG: AAA family ATPase, partial [Candidatus Aminicenantes bacterium]|nr:AAA family ATPase [Candidatus Aminicenantes bacterium]NIM84724.1 AAA family ATPase [Candidatus Aminicenantes bacterium]NIN24218.1 AAA family ATPase [Candidatus Aminicenantes bacterium]NIN47945.1 AAA family ATPase [Candidatus Aminicenantes bacterium]NIN90881.1 AAA family ATPase [Candidatus Aminicenantes bacterium]